MQRELYWRAAIGSSRWDKFREECIARTNGTCEMCSRETKRLEVHHLSYERLGEEKYEDVMVLCVRCHRGIHPQRLRTRNALERVGIPMNWDEESGGV